MPRGAGASTVLGMEKNPRAAEKRSRRLGRAKRVSKRVLSALATILIIAVVGAVLAFPSIANGDLYKAITSASASEVEGKFPTMSTMTDSDGNPIAWFYEQHRVEVPTDHISPAMKEAIVAIEDRRFYEHNGIDGKGVARAMWENILAGGVEQGSSTLEQQFIKNYNLLIRAEDDTARKKAVERSVQRKAVEMKVASELGEHMTKDQVLSRYLNLVSFGNHAYGIQAAAQTYFAVNAADLTVPQAALLAGMVQAPTTHDPYMNPDSATARRNSVLDALAATGKISLEDAKAFKEEPLGVAPEPRIPPSGCIAAGNRGFLCDYAVQELERSGISNDMLRTGGYVITTTLNPVVQDSAKAAVDAQVAPETPNVAQVLNVLEPSTDSRRILAMTSNRGYGLNEGTNETMQPLPFSQVGAGAGSVFKIFTAAAAMERGMGTNTMLDTPARYEASGMGTGGAAGCPPGKYCVENAGTYKSPMSVPDALAQSPNTTFVKLQEQVGLDAVVDISVRLGLRSYDREGTSGVDGRSLASITKEEKRGSYTLGATAIDALELSNVAATLASDGMWCEPTALAGVADAAGNPVPLPPKPCDQAVEPGLANTLSSAMTKDTISGTAEASAKMTGWTLPVAAKTGTTESHRSSAFLAFTNTMAGASYVFDDSTTPQPICTGPLRSCASGDVFGGLEPARAWMNAILPVADLLGPVEAPSTDPRFVQGTSSARVPNITGMWVDDALDDIRAAGFPFEIQLRPGAEERGRVMAVTPNGSVMPGSQVTIVVSDGSLAPPPPPPPATTTTTSPEDDSEDETRESSTRPSETTRQQESYGTSEDDD